MASLATRVAGRWRRTLAERAHRRMVALRNARPIVTFTFDDAPRTAFTVGGDILADSGIRATYFLSLGLLGQSTEVGTIANREDLARAVAAGHELGCHTFDHLDAWSTPDQTFIDSILENQRELSRILPGTRFRTFAYPKSGARAGLKRRLEAHFVCCRGGGESPNVDAVDMNLVKACFLDRRTGKDSAAVKRLIDLNASSNGWLVLATHDVGDDPSPFGCSTGLLEQIVRAAVESGAVILPLGEACGQLQRSVSAVESAK